MAYEFTVIHMASIDSGGAQYEIAGTWGGRDFRIDLWCEYDGRDVESEPAAGHDYDPFFDENEDGTFLDKLCEDPRFMNLHNAGYKCWELFPTDE